MRRKDLGVTWVHARVCKSAPPLQNIIENLGEMIILIYVQSFFFRVDMKVTLSLPNQVRVVKNIFDNVPKQFIMGRLLHGIHIHEMDLAITFKLF